MAELPKPRPDTASMLLEPIARAHDLIGYATDKDYGLMDDAIAFVLARLTKIIDLLDLQAETFDFYEQRAEIVDDVEDVLAEHGIRTDTEHSLADCVRGILNRPS